MQIKNCEDLCEGIPFEWRRTAMQQILAVVGGRLAAISICANFNYTYLRKERRKAYVFSTKAIHNLPRAEKGGEGKTVVSGRKTVQNGKDSFTRGAGDDEAQQITQPKMKYLKPLEFYTGFFKDILSGTSPSHGRLLGFHVHSKYVSLAVSDCKNITAVPLRTLPWPKRKAVMVDTIATSISKYDIVGFIVGSPYVQCLDNTPFSPHAKKFIENISETRKFRDLKLTFWDGGIAIKNAEFVFDQHVEYVLRHLGGEASKVRPKEITSKCYAVRVLQGYLDAAHKLSAEECI